MIVALVAACTAPETPDEPPAWRFTEPFRPQVHYTPAAGWLNDPNGLVRHGGVWHLYFQHNPDGDGWGNLHWGHATSADLVAWEHAAVAVFPDALGAPYSGSAVPHADGIAIVYTAAGDAQQQVLAIGDGGVFPAPELVLPNPGERDFRDPKVLPYGDGFVMALAVGEHIAFYASDDLRAWTPLSTFTPPGDAGVRECPDLFPLDDRWVLVWSELAGGPQGGSGQRYAVGEFDGVAFVPDDDAVRFLDHGADAYAWQSWSGADPRVGVSWMSNWSYALRVPTAPFRGAMTLPRELSLVDGALAQRPVPALDALVWGPADEAPLLRVAGTIPDGGRLRFVHGDAEVSLALADGALVLERPWDVSGGFPTAHRAAVETAPIDVDVWLDTSSIEVFADGGRVVLTDLVFPDGDAWSVAVEGGAEATSDALRTAWPADD